MDQLTAWIGAHGLIAIAALLLVLGVLEACSPRESGGSIGLRWTTN